VACSVLLAATLLLIVRTARIAVVATRHNLVVRNFFHTRVIPWSDIAGFGAPSEYGAYRKAGLKIMLVSGGVVSVSAFGAGPFDRSAFADETLAELEQMRQWRLKDGPPPRFV